MLSAQFLIIKDAAHAHNLPAFLAAYTEYGALAVNWRVRSPYTSCNSGTRELAPEGKCLHRCLAVEATCGHLEQATTC